MNAMRHNRWDDASDFSILVWQEHLETETDDIQIYTVDFVHVFKATCQKNLDHFIMSKYKQTCPSEQQVPSLQAPVRLDFSTVVL